MTGLCSMMDVRGTERASAGGCLSRQAASGRDAVELDREMARTSQDRARPVLGRVRDESGLLQPARQLRQRDLRLSSGEGSAEAGVDAAAEPEMLVVLAFGIEAIRVAEAVGIAVAGCEHE